MYIIKSKKILLKFVLLLSLISCTSHKLSSLQNKLLDEFKYANDYQLAVYVAESDINNIKRYCKDNPDVINRSFTNESYNSVLHLSVKLRNVESVKALLECGMNPNVSYPNTPIYDATNCDFDFYGKSSKIPNAKQRYSIIELLIAYNVDCNVIDYNQHCSISPEGSGITPLINLVETGKDILPDIKLLIEKGNANVNFSDKVDVNLLHVAIHNKSISLEVPLYLMTETNIKLNNNEIYNDMSITSLLRYRVEDLDSKEYNFKQQIIEYLETMGVDYYAEDIPDIIYNYVVNEYTDNSEEFLKKY